MPVLLVRLHHEGVPLTDLLDLGATRLEPASWPASIPAPDLGGLLHGHDRLEFRLASFKKSADQLIELLAFLED